MTKGLTKRLVAWLSALVLALVVAPSMAFADEAEPPAEGDTSNDVVFTIYNSFPTGIDAEGNPIVQYTVAKAFTQADLEALKPAEPQKLGYMMNAKNKATVLATNDYVLVKDLLKPAKVTLQPGDTLGFVDGSPYGEDVKRYVKWTASYDDLQGDLKFFSGYSADNPTNVVDPDDAPAIIALTYGQEEVATSAYEAFAGIATDAKSEVRFMTGQTQDSFVNDGLRAGSNFPSGITGLIVDKSSSLKVLAKSATSTTDPALVKEFSWTDMLGLATTNEKGIAVNWNGDKVAVATQYAPVEDIISAAGLKFAEGDVARVADPTDFGHNVSYVDLHNADNPMNYYPHTMATGLITEGAVEVGAVLGLKFIKTVTIEGESDAEDAVAAALASQEQEYGFQWMPGATKDDYTKGENSGKRMISGANVVTVTMANVANATVSAAKQAYTGKALTPKVSVTMPDGTALVQGTDYDVAFANNTKVGTAKITVTGKGAYQGTVQGSFAIQQASQTVKASNKSAGKLCAKKLAKKAQTIKASKVTKGNSAKTALSYKLVKANKSKAKFKVASNGKITVKKGLKKGTYKLTIKASAKADANYKAASKNFTVTIKVTK